MKLLPLLATLSCIRLGLASSGGRSIQVSLQPYFNNKAFGSFPGEASLDALGQSYPADPVGTNGTFVSKSSGVSYLFPGYNHNANTLDNVICDGQTILIPPSKHYFSASVLLVSDVRSTTISGNLTFVYTDNTTSTAEVRAHAFWWFLAIRRGEISYPYFFTRNDTNHNASHIYERHAPIESGKTLSGVVLPHTTNSTSGRLHIFSLSLWEAGDCGIQVQAVRPTQSLDDYGRQIVEVITNHAGNHCVSNLDFTLVAEGGGATDPTVLKRFCPGDQKRINLAVEGAVSGRAAVHINCPSCKRIIHPIPSLDIAVRDWTPEPKSLTLHEAPRWYTGGKFGIFIHWGPYSVPGWGNSTPYESYSEWFWWYSTRVKEHAAADKSGFNAYRLRTFGPNLNYDDFFTNFTASNFNPKEWVDLIAGAGAQYFVLTSKHHDGFSLFNAAQTTYRTALNFGPRRDLLGELFDAAKVYQPHLRRGSYFSLPEWFNPDWGKYGFTQFDRITSTSHPGIIARNPYTNLDEPYTGHIPVGDFIQDLMIPQMEILAYKYETDIMWCDAGASNGTDAFAARWFNWARERGRQVTINDRCGSPWVSDFDTPEYATFSVAQHRKWESNQGMDPYSYGFNRETPDDEYMNATTLVHNLVDIVSKNGNFLLNIGPRADGSIHQSMVDNLLEAGKWIHTHGDAIFNTTYWYITPEEGDIRFTQTNDAFYILSTRKPSPGRLEISSAIPIVKGDTVTAITLEGEMELEWGVASSGKIWLSVTSDAINADKYCWVFKISYQSE